MNPKLQTQSENEEGKTHLERQALDANRDDDQALSENNFAAQDYYAELKYRSVSNAAVGKLAGGLALFSIGLGLAEILAPAYLGELIGIDKKREKVLPFFGAREIASGIAITKSQNPAAAVWSRVAGDALDLAFLVSAYASSDTKKSKVTAAIAAVLGVTVLDVICAQRLSQGLDETGENPYAPTTVGQTSARRSVDES
jgi:hypothetical protein